MTLFAGPALGWPEGYDAHRARLGPRPRGGPDVIAALERSGLKGRGGAGFPVGVKWRTVAGNAAAGAEVIGNGAEGEPLSGKDRALLANRPHLVLDGALIAVESVGAERATLYVGEAHRTALMALRRALADRPAAERERLHLVAAPHSYVAGEESAAVHFLNDGVATPTAVPPRPFESGVGGRPTLVQNVESLAHAALIARQGASDTRLVTVSGAVRRPAVLEAATSATPAEAIELAGGAVGVPRAVLLGGYFGRWAGQKGDDGELNCGVVYVLSEEESPLKESARVIQHLAAESAAQCGPCFFGLRSLAAATERIASGRAEERDLERLHRWVGMVRGRGACRHPDGAAGFMESALTVFAQEFATAAR